jgi:hypothetical protein
MDHRLNGLNVQLASQVAGSYTITTLLFEVSQKGDQPDGRQLQRV